MIVNLMLNARGLKNSVTIRWWNRFRVRHPEVSLRMPAILSVSRARASSRESINVYFDVLENVLVETGLVEYPSLIYSMDETGFPLGLKTIHRKGEKQLSSVISGSKRQVTVVACVSATGQAIPLFIIWKRKNMTISSATGEIPGTR